MSTTILILSLNILNAWQNGERGILIYRTPDTRVPSPLLIDLPPPNDCPSDQSPFGSNQNLQEAGIEAVAPVAKKMTMMMKTTLISLNFVL